MSCVLGGRYRGGPDGVQGLGRAGVRLGQVRVLPALGDGAPGGRVHAHELRGGLLPGVRHREPAEGTDGDVAFGGGQRGQYTVIIFFYIYFY